MSEYSTTPNWAGSSKEARAKGAADIGIMIDIIRERCVAAALEGQAVKITDNADVEPVNGMGGPIEAIFRGITFRIDIGRPAERTETPRAMRGPKAIDDILLTRSDFTAVCARIERAFERLDKIEAAVFRVPDNAPKVGSLVERFVF